MFCLGFRVWGGTLGLEGCENKGFKWREAYRSSYMFLHIDRIWDIWGPYDNLPKAIFYLLRGTIIPKGVSTTHFSHS